MSKCNRECGTRSVVSTLRAAETAGDLLLDLEHAQVTFGLVIIERHPEVMQESQYRGAMRHQPIEQVARGRLFGTTTLPSRFRGRVGPQTFLDETRVGRFITRQLFGPQCCLSGRLSIGHGRLHPQQQFDQFRHPGLAGVFVQTDQLAQQVSVAQRVQPGQVEVGSPGIMHAPPQEADQQADGLEGYPPAFGVMRVESQQAGAEHTLRDPGAATGDGTPVSHLPHRQVRVGVPHGRLPQSLPNGCSTGAKRV
jgi:hypothetical protein